MEDYEKKYREAIERAKTIDKREYGDIISTIFPELAESEDGKLIKEIIYIVKQYRESLISEGSHRFDDCIAWLEKQKSITCNTIDSISDEKIRKNCIHFLELQKSHHAGTSEIEECIAWLEKQGERNPAWSEEDYKRIDYICDFIWKNRKGDTDEIYQQEQDVKWLKSLKQRLGGK